MSGRRRSQARLGSISRRKAAGQELEELESIRAYDAAKASGDEAIPLDQAVAEIERDNKMRDVLIHHLDISAGHEGDTRGSRISTVDRTRPLVCLEDVFSRPGQSGMAPFHGLSYSCDDLL